MKSLYVIRRSETWAKGGIDPWARPMQQLWDSVFSVSFLGYRKFLNSLHEENVATIPFTDRIEHHEFDLSRKLMLPGRIVFPTDDDDWFHPNLLEILEDRIDPEARAHRWRYGVLEKDKALVYGDHDYLDRSRWRYQSNNYCFTTPRINLDLDHCTFDVEYAGYPDERYIDETLSIHNRHLGSQSLWWHHPVNNAEDLIQLYRSFKQPPSGVFPAVFDDLIERLYDFYKKIKIVKKRRWF